ncbi:U2 snRNP-associated protein Sap145 [Schizosaccharomyces cryophilus OY26]|uniref:U2 snRNP-associated protein Sap145 n=1 Tax=Schizosaccharomyces cryophilus (strain OY26 / ATCC MYA-4695 / CBS 11777 / NBRC 106824 / NRRL Y48691) TaxID=653667 RepID=S9X9G6_SCHCR|nr:U2 snRNP-associated protein Sap145 [Schizosaccharomyces cryophilus OY26]EPY50356.1 U2 snRNP-associated protein Sap145 [Schizosaccharomyces cryophilus OY26]
MGETASVQPAIEKENGVLKESAQEKQRKSRNQVRRQKKKFQREQQQSQSQGKDGDGNDWERIYRTEGRGASNEAEKDYETTRKSGVSNEADPLLVVDYLNMDSSDPLFSQYRDIINQFVAPEPEADAGAVDKGQVMYSDDEVLSEGEEDALQKREEEKLSRKKLRKMRRMTVAHLKMISEKPDVVEWWDVSSPDPLLLTHLKAYPNTVPVPRHWNQKRDYLSGQRGIERQLFELPSYIRATGIVQMRNAVHENEADLPLRQKMRERVQPKMGKLDIDYQKLHDAFFRYQTKPVLTGFGECYYEGKELEANVKEKRPGDISEELREALGIPSGAPPPWLYAMQKFGPPPSYPDLKIPGVNFPIPVGAQWGYHPGGWGKPPVDQYNRPLYGDVFGSTKPRIPAGAGPPEEVQHWGELEEFEEEESSEEEEEEEEEEEGEEAGEESVNANEAGYNTRTTSAQQEDEGVESISYFDQRPIEAENFELRKQFNKREDDSSRPLYQVLPEQHTNVEGFMGPDHRYQIPTNERVRSSKRSAEEAEAPDNRQNDQWQNDLSEMVSEQASIIAAKRQKTQPKKEKFRL